MCVGCYAVNCFASSKLGFVAIIPLSCVRSMVTFIYSLKRIVMALKFKLVMRKNLGEDHESIPEKVYAQWCMEIWITS